MLSPRRGIIFTAPILMFGPVTHNTFVHVRLSLPPTYLCLMSFPPSGLCFSVRPRCDSMFPISERIVIDQKKKCEGLKKAELSQWSQHLPVFNWREIWTGGRRVYHMSHLKSVSAHLHGMKQKLSFFFPFQFTATYFS